MIGESIHQYKIQRELGRGGMAVVYLAHDNKFDTQVAIKVLNKEYVHNDNIRKRFLAEARNMYRMSHPNIIKVTDLIDDGDIVAFVMEYIEGATLKEYLERKGKLSDDEIKLLFSQMLDAVGYVHKQNLVHRDIKPSNFMIDREGKIKLMDFGIAKNTDANSAEYTQTGTGVQMGTPMYMSPEQIRATHNVTNQSDIYSLGVVLWQMVAGRKPYDSSTLAIPEIQTCILNQPLPAINKFWDPTIEKATKKSVLDRFGTITEFRDAISNSFNQVASEADEPKLPQIKDKEFPKKLKPILIAVLIVLAVGIVFNPASLQYINRDTLVNNMQGVDSSRYRDSILALNAQAAADSAAAAFKVMNLEESLGMKMILVPGAPYYLSETEITQEQLYEYKEMVNPGAVFAPPKNPYLPENYISWEEANAFCKWAGGRLPTVEQWQYAARAGESYTFSGSNNIDGVAWYKGNTNGNLQPVKTKLPNAYGFYDMSGNVMEWTNTISGNKRALCGGGYNSSPEFCKIANYTDGEPSFSDPFIGFRLLIPISSQEY